MPRTEAYLPLSDYLPAAFWPSDLVPMPAGTFLDKIAWDDGDIISGDESLSAWAEMRIMVETSIDLPAGFAIVFGNGSVRASLEVDAEGFQAKIAADVIKIRLPRTLFVPVIEENSELRADPDPTHFVDIPLPVALGLNSAGDIDFDFPEESTGISLPQCMIGQSGVIISASDIRIHLSSNQPLPDGAGDIGLEPDWKGLFIGEADIHLPPGLGNAVPSDLTFTNCYIGSGGFSGTVEATWSPAFSGTLFGIELGLHQFALTFVQNALTRSDIQGTLLLPYFDEPLDIGIAFSTNGDLLVSLSSASGLIVLEKPGIIRVTVEGIAFAVEGGVFSVRITGEIRPLVAGIDWPGFRVQALTIDSEGHVHVEGGWINLRDQYALDFHGFRIEVTQLGFGNTDDGGRWIGFSGGVRLIDGLSAGASVEGLRVAWYPDGHTGISLNGVGVELTIPNVLRFHGHVDYRELPGNVHRFDGAIRLELLSLGMTVDAQLVIGTQNGSPFFAIFLAAELPAGIPLWATGLSLYGMAGLFAIEMAPNKLPAEGWYENPDLSDGWYKRPPIGITDLTTKWDPQAHALALGAGITIGTVDNGFTFSGSVLLAIVFPGPILLIEGKANLLKERSRLSEEPLFRALAVLDGNAGTFLVALDARYKYGSGGQLLDIRGGAEAFFDFHDASRWHLYLGRDTPRERRIRAQIISIFEANAYLMIDPNALATGAWVGYAKHWQFGPLSVGLEAWIEGNARLSWKPAYLHGDLHLHGHADLRVFGFGFGMTADASIAADVFDPFHVSAGLSVSVDLPWPLHDIDVDIVLEWGPDHVAPRVPLPLKEIAIEHFKSTASWPLPRDGAAPLLLPNYDDGGFISGGAAAGQETAPPPLGLPVVPLDCRPHVTFGRTVHDDALIGCNGQPVLPGALPHEGWEWIGDPSGNAGPARARYGLQEISIDRWTGGGWSTVVRKAAAAAGPNPAGVPTLYGSWAPVPDLGSGNPAAGTPNAAANNKLWLWSRTPFDYTRHSGREWSDWFLGAYPTYPCIPAAGERTVCHDFARDLAGTTFNGVQRWNALMSASLGSTSGTVTRFDPRVEGFAHALCIDGGAIRIVLSEPAKSVRILVEQDSGTPAVGDCIDFRGRDPRALPNPYSEAESTFVSFGASGQNAGNQILLAAIGSVALSGLDCGLRLVITLASPADAVDITLSYDATPPRLLALDEEKIVASAVAPAETGVLHTITLRAAVIRTVVIEAPKNRTWLHEICVTSSAAVTPRAVAYDEARKELGTFAAQGNVIDVGAGGTFEVLVSGAPRVCIIQVCATFGPDPAGALEHSGLAQHMAEETARWSAEGEVLAPYTDYRIKVVTTAETADFPFDASFNRRRTQTEFAYFRTEGPPGLAALTLPPDTESQLSTLAPYVRQTIPPTVNGPGEKPSLPRPVYRAYDVSVAFNEDYVDQMYRMSGRDLGLYLFDDNGLAARDASGGLLIPAPQWGRAETLTLDASETLWLATIDRSTCSTSLSIDTASIPRDGTLSLERVVLAPDTIYEARLVPLLLHDDFSSLALGASASGPAGAIGRWTIRDDGTNEGPSHWEIGEDVSRFVRQTSNIWGGTTAAADPVKPGTVLLYAGDPSLPFAHPDSPDHWTDYRFSAIMRSADDDAIGLVVRYQNPSSFYRFSMDASLLYRRLVRVSGGVHTVLAEDGGGYDADRDYLVAFEAVGSRLRIYVDGTTLFDVDDAVLASGGAGLYCWASAGARFSDIRCEDIRATATPAYRFRFQTSLYTNVYHHLHSFNDEVWPAGIVDAAGVAPLLAAAVPPSAAPTEGEARAYDAIAALAFPAAAAEQPTRGVEVERMQNGAVTIMDHVRFGEPIDWTRTLLELSEAAESLPVPLLPLQAKLTEVAAGAAQPIDETVTIVVREDTDLTGCQIRYRIGSAGPLDPAATDWLPYYTFGTGETFIAGTVVRISSGNASAAGPAGGAELRFVATGTSAGLVLFTAASVDVLLFSPDGSVLHARRFLAASAYTPASTRIIRKRDGAAMFIAGPAAGQRRLTFTFNRDNRSTDPSSLVLSEGGDRTAERVVLDVP